jgi:pyridoxamine 5'-phosphate oxidase
MADPLSEKRREYAQPVLRKADLDPDPITQFLHWFADAERAGVADVTAMTLATVSADGWPSARIVLLKGCDKRGLVFYTNRSSDKARELAANPRAEANFFWRELDRQVRVAGDVISVPDHESDAYFRGRPRGSQLSAWASAQSREIDSREAIERAYAEANDRFRGRDVPRPDFWGGYRIEPAQLELWQGRLDRLHDRLRYRRLPDGDWIIERLAP